jgi:hypothetical protein
MMAELMVIMGLLAALATAPLVLGSLAALQESGPVLTALWVGVLTLMLLGALGLLTLGLLLALV